MALPTAIVRGEANNGAVNFILVEDGVPFQGSARRLQAKLSGRDPCQGKKGKNFQVHWLLSNASIHG
jgi:hypothetical protein